MGMDESSTLRQQLPERWVAKIFQELQGNYGTRFLNQWKTGQTLADGTDAGVKNAMATWARKLSGFIDMPEVFKDVLESLPSDPPSAPEFVNLCRDAARRKAPNNPMLSYVPTEEDKARAEEVIQQAAKQITRDTRDHRAWVTALLKRQENGEKLSIIQLNAIKEAMAV